MSVDATWQTEPFPHAVIRGMWPDADLREIRAEFPEPEDPRWITYPAEEERGKRAGAEDCWGPATREFIDALRSPAMCSWLSALTGIGPLTPDTIGGGMHMTTEGGRLAMHVDFNVHPSLPLERRLNLLVFLEEDWDETWGGTLYLGADRETYVEPLLNTTVIFETSEHSWHGHPEPITCPVKRRSIAVYYYAPLRPETATPHTTEWLT